MELKDWMIDAMTRRGLSVRGLTAALRDSGVDYVPATIGAWRRGKARPAADVWPVVLDVLNIEGADRDVANAVYAGDTERVEVAR